MQDAPIPELGFFTKLIVYSIVILIVLGLFVLPFEVWYQLTGGGWGTDFPWRSGPRWPPQAGGPEHPDLHRGGAPVVPQLHARLTEITAGAPPRTAPSEESR